MACSSCDAVDNGLQTPDTGGNPRRQASARHAARQVGVLYWRQWEGGTFVMFGQDDSSGGVSSSAFSGDG